MIDQSSELPNDKRLRQRAMNVIPGGMYGHQNAARLPEGYPQFMQRGEGCHVWDVDGNQYVDLMCAYGPIVLGYAHPEVDTAAASQHALADVQNGPSACMVELAELFVDTVDHADWAMFAKNGTDATTLCSMVARATTGKKKIMVASGAYHGAAPWCTPVTAGTTADERSQLLHYKYNDLESVDAVLAQHGDDIAGIFVSPFKHDAGFDQELADPAFAQGLRDRCDKHGCALILDDVRCGFRLQHGGSWESLGVTPDLSAWSKAIANGYPIAAVLGNNNFRDGAQQLFVTGSFWYSAVAMAAAIATIGILKREQAIVKMQQTGQQLREGLEKQAAAYNVAINQTGPVQMPYVTFACDRDHSVSSLFAATAIRHGVYLHPKHNWFLSAAHTKTDIEAVLTATEKAFAVVAESMRQEPA